MTAAETSKTITSLVNFGTLSTLWENSTPLGTFVRYIIDDRNSKIYIRLRRDAVHT